MDDDNNSVEEVIDNDDGEDLHLQKRAAQHDETANEDDSIDDENDESGSSKCTGKYIILHFLIIMSISNNFVEENKA